MFIVFGSYALLGLLLTVVFAAWAAAVGYVRNRHADPELRLDIIIGLIIISVLTGIGGVIAAYLDHPPITPDAPA